MNPQKKLKTYNITYREHEGNPISVKTVTYSANSSKEAEELFYADYPEQRERTYIEIHSPLENYAIDRYNEEILQKSAKSAENTQNSAENPDNTPNNSKKPMKKFNILNIFKSVNEYVKELTMLLVGIIPLLLLGVVIFGDDFFLGNVVVYNIQNILDSMAGFVGIVSLILIVAFFHKFYKNN